MSAEPVVTDNQRDERYEARIGDALAGVVEYSSSSHVIVFTHTEVDPAFEGQGIGGVLARSVLDDARRRGLAVLPVCPFIKSWIDAHPDYADLVH